jgi:hypothetical protein
VLVDSVFKVTQIFAQMLADIAPRKSLAIRESSGHFEQDSGGARLSTP